MDKSPDAVPVNYGTFRSVKALRDELNRLLRDNRGKDVPLRPPVEAVETQRGHVFVSLGLVPARHK